MSEETINQLHQMVGRLQGEMTGIRTSVSNIETSVGSIDDRLLSVEKKSAVNGAVSGGVVGVAVALITTAFKAG